MILWIIAVCLLAGCAIVGYYQGAIRVAFSCIGLLIASLLALPLAGPAKMLLRVFGLSHPVVLSFVAPAVIFLLVLIIFKTSALAVHKKIDAYYKYKAS